MVFCISLAPTPSSAQQVTQQAPQRDPQAVAVLVGTFKALGGNLPSDSVATGNIQIVAGSKTETGTIRILTRGFDQTVEQIDTVETHQALIYSKGRATLSEGGIAKPLPLELAVTSQSPDFPLGLISNALNDLNGGMAYLGRETINGTSAHHIRIWTTFPVLEGLDHLTDFSVKNLWIDAGTGLPIRLAFARRAARGPSPAIPHEIFYSDFRSIGGVMYPFRIDRSLNGTPWTTITISAVRISQGLADVDFPMATGAIR
jgi:hypothetical protein